jgi:signal transduction histidine kinase/ActR/RegA family two-component response regulator
VPGIPLRRQLVLLTAAGILPLALLAGIGLYVLVREQRMQARRVGTELARSVATAVDVELRSSTSVLEALATSLTLDRQDLPGFLERARRVLALQPNWDAITLVDPSGKPLVDTRYATGEALPPVAEPGSFDRVVRTRASVVGGLARDPKGAWFFPVRVPVVRDGALRYVITAVVRPKQVHGVLTSQDVPGDWVISIVDSAGLRVARSRAHEENVGGKLSPTVQAVVAQGGAEGFGVSYTLEGERIYTPYSRLSQSGWVAVLGMPTALAERAAYRSLAVYGGGVLLSIGLGTLAAFAVARSISRPMAALGAAAQALGRREPPRTPETGIQEIREVSSALTAAAGQILEGEAQRDLLLRKERAARESAEAADRAKDAFMAVLSHELRTPLNAAYGWARMLQSGHITDEPTVARALDAIVRNADVQVQLIDDLLDITRITSGKMRLDVRPVDMDGVLQGALDAVRPAADAKTIRIQTVIDPRAGPVTGDPARLQQVVWNLLMNAVKFTSRGGLVQLHLQRVNSHVEIVVSDTGEGIAPDVLPHVFERFLQADSSSTRKHGGLGLGLSLVKHLVELHGGTVTAHSDGDGRGATFVVSLPVAIADVRAASAPRVHPLTASGESRPDIVRIDGVRVLVVDDDVEAVALAQAILTGAGAEVRISFEAGPALAMLRGWLPDVLVSDIEMPGEDGYSLIRKVRALSPDEGGLTPAVALTGYGRTQDRTRSLAAGYSMHVPKPVDPGELTAIVASVAGRTTPARRGTGPGPEPEPPRG